MSSKPAHSRHAAGSARKAPALPVTGTRTHYEWRLRRTWWGSRSCGGAARFRLRAPRIDLGDRGPDGSELGTLVEKETRACIEARTPMLVSRVICQNDE